MNHACTNQYHAIVGLGSFRLLRRLRSKSPSKPRSKSPSKPRSASKPQSDTQSSSPAKLAKSTAQHNEPRGLAPASIVFGPTRFTTSVSPAARGTNTLVSPRQSAHPSHGAPPRDHALASPRTTGGVAPLPSAARGRASGTPTAAADPSAARGTSALVSPRQSASTVSAKVAVPVANSARGAEISIRGAVAAERRQEMATEFRTTFHDGEGSATTPAVNMALPYMTASPEASLSANDSASIAADLGAEVRRPGPFSHCARTVATEKLRPVSSSVRQVDPVSSLPAHSDLR